jgi:DNA-directed RNA polymerase specialized sigma24 family protein
MSDWKTLELHPTEVLIDFFQGQTQPKEVGKNAYLALMFRFRKDLLNKCEIICKKRGFDIDVAQIVAERTFKKYGRSKKFRIEECKSSCVDTCFKLYLYAIAKNELNNYFREEEKRKNGLLYDGSENIITEIPNLDLESLDEEDRIIHETLTSLPYSHQVIYLTYKVHEKEGVNLPKSLRMKLREHLGGIEQSTVRTYKKEATDKLESVKKIIQRLS